MTRVELNSARFLWEINGQKRGVGFDQKAVHSSMFPSVTAPPSPIRKVRAGFISNWSRRAVVTSSKFLPNRDSPESGSKSVIPRAAQTESF